MKKGIVESWVESQGSGIISNSSGRNMYLHHTSLATSTQRPLIAGEILYYEESVTSSGLLLPLNAHRKSDAKKGSSKKMLTQEESQAKSRQAFIEEMAAQNRCVMCGSDIDVKAGECANCRQPTGSGNRNWAKGAGKRNFTKTFQSELGYSAGQSGAPETIEDDE